MAFEFQYNTSIYRSVVFILQINKWEAQHDDNRITVQYKCVDLLQLLRRING